MTQARTRNRQVTAHDLLEAVGGLLSREGFASLGVNSVARAADVDPVSTALVIATSIHYLIARSRLHPDFNGFDIDTDDGWSRIEEIVHTIAHRTIRAKGSLEHEDPAGTTPR